MKNKQVSPYVERACKYGETYARQLFSQFLDNVNFRGSKFKWGKFSDMCGQIAGVGVFTLYSDKEWWSFTHEGRKSLGEFAYQAATTEAEKLVKKSRVVE